MREGGEEGLSWSWLHPSPPSQKKPNSSAASSWTTWWNHSCCTGSPFPDSQHYIVFNSYNLVRVSRRLHSPCHSHRSRARAAQRYTAAASRSRGSSSHELSPTYPCQSSARATPFAIRSCLCLVRCVTHIHFSGVLAATCQYHPIGNTRRSFISYLQKECKYRPSGNPPCHRWRPTCWTWPFDEATACGPAYGQFWTGQTCWTWPHSRCGK